MVAAVLVLRKTESNCFCHEPTADACDAEIAGHLHPVARLSLRGRAISRRCFASDGRRMVMPAFGAYAGGLSIRDRAFAGLIGQDDVPAPMWTAICRENG